MKELDAIIHQTIEEVAKKLKFKSLVREYGFEWNKKLEQALQEFEKRLAHPRRKDTPAVELLKNLQNDFGLNDYETFMVGENSTYPTSDEFWQEMGPRYAKFLGGYGEYLRETLPLSGEEKYSKQEPGGEMAAANVSTATWREGEEEQIHVVGYGMVPLATLKSRLKKMLFNSLLDLRKGKYSNVNHAFGLNSVGSSFITALAKYQEQKDEQGQNLQ